MVPAERKRTSLRLTLANTAGENIVFRRHRYGFMLDRSMMSQLYAEEFGSVESTEVERVNHPVYVDKSVIEIFINGGKHTMTSRFFIDDFGVHCR